MKITWFGHSCFKIEKDGYAIVVDPYTKGSVPGLSLIHIQMCIRDRLTGSIMTMPGLPKKPAAEGIDVVNGKITGLF